MAEKNNTQMPDVNEQIKNRMDKLKTLQEEGRDPFEITKYDVTNHTQDIKEHFEDFEGKEVSIAGRLMAKRVMVKPLSAMWQIKGQHSVICSKRFCRRRTVCTF